MSILPEYIIQQTLVKGIRTFREKPRLIRMLFRNLRQSEVDSIIDFFRDKSIDICLNYPNTNATIPAIVILLKSETEAEAFIGELQQDMGDLDLLGGQTFPVEELSGDQSVLGAGSTSTVGNRKVYLEPTTAIGGGSNYITAPEGTTRLIDPYETDDPFGGLLEISLMEGTGAGQQREILSITPSLVGAGVEIVVTPDWDTAPDDTSVFKIVGKPNENITGEPPQLYADTDRIERLGQIYKSIYQLDIVGSDQDMAVYLYNIVKAIFVASRRFLVQQGFLTNLKMSGSDLAPISGYYPTLAYRRSLNLEFMHAFDVYTDVSEAIATEITVALSTHHPNVSEDSGVERVAIETTLDLS